MPAGQDTNDGRPRESPVSAGFDLAQTDHLLTTTRAVRKRLDLTRAGRAVGAPRLHPDRLAGAERLERAAVAVDRGDRSREEEDRRPLLRLSFADYIAPKLEPDRARRPRQRSHDRLGQLPGRAHGRGTGARHPVRARPTARGQRRRAVRPASGAASFRRCGASSSRLRSRGLGSAWTTLHLNYESEVGDALGVPPHRDAGGAPSGRVLHGQPTSSRRRAAPPQS